MSAVEKEMDMYYRVMLQDQPSHTAGIRRKLCEDCTDAGVATCRQGHVLPLPAPGG